MLFASFDSCSYTFSKLRCNLKIHCYVKYHTFLTYYKHYTKLDQLAFLHFAASQEALISFFTLTTVIYVKFIRSLSHMIFII